MYATIIQIYACVRPHTATAAVLIANGPTTAAAGRVKNARRAASRAGDSACLPWPAAAAAAAILLVPSPHCRTRASTPFFFFSFFPFLFSFFLFFFFTPWHDDCRRFLTRRRRRPVSYRRAAAAADSFRSARSARTFSRLSLCRRNPRNCSLALHLYLYKVTTPSRCRVAKIFNSRSESNPNE